MVEICSNFTFSEEFLSFPAQVDTDTCMVVLAFHRSADNPLYNCVGIYVLLHKYPRKTYVACLRKW